MESKIIAKGRGKSKFQFFAYCKCLKPLANVPKQEESHQILNQSSKEMHFTPNIDNRAKTSIVNLKDLSRNKNPVTLRPIRGPLKEITNLFHYCYYSNRCNTFPSRKDIPLYTYPSKKIK